ncbi:MAG: DeoR/GlpR family DNA-binding transcription regulator [Spirosomataceae bacterium]
MHKVVKVMLKKERQDYILRQINLHNKVLSADLCEELNVSEDTIRRDLNELSDLGQILKVHGGALSKSFYDDNQSDDVYAYQEKVKIAEKTLKLFKNGMFVLTGGGTTIREILKRLPEDLQITFITVSLSAATEILNHPNCEIIFIGGKISRNTRFSTGGETISRLSEIKADLCLMGTNAIDAVAGVTDSDYESVQVKKAMMQAAEKVAIVTIAEKLGSAQRLRICKTHELDYLITELDPEDPQLAQYQKIVNLI